MKGYCGKILHVNLTDGVATIEAPNESFYRQYVGGSLLAAYYVFNNMRPGADALSPENVLVFATSPTTGAPISGSSRFSVNAKSPLTGAIGDSQGGGFFGVELRHAGFDAIVLTGKSPRPVYLWIHDGEFEIKDASGIWGKLTGDAQAIIRDELGDPKVRVALIGPGGENLVRYACITNELKHFNGRTGMGAVMGSKNLKAIAVRGSMSPEFFNKSAIQDMARDGAKRSLTHPVAVSLREYGTAVVVGINQAMGGLPTHNWTSGVFDEAEKITGATMKATILEKNESCWACAVRCKRVVKASEPYEVDPAYGGPEYETIAALGSYLAIGDLVGVSKANELCNKYGIDTISTGGTIAFAMECFENAIITSEDTGGIDLRFGNTDAVLQIIPMIGRREGIGDLLAEGAARAAAKLGKGAEKFAIHCKGQEFPAHMPQIKASLALAYSCGPFGADHQSSNHDGCLASERFGSDIASLGFRKSTPSRELNFEKVKLWGYTQRLSSLLDTLDLCQFCYGADALFGLDDIVSLVNAATGWRTNLWELMQVGEKRVNLLRAFNAREGFSAEDDTLPDRIFEPLVGGCSDGQRIDRDAFAEARTQYYELCGWDPSTGNPTQTKLEELGLGWATNA